MKVASTTKDIYRVQNALKTLESYGDADLIRCIKPMLEQRLGKNRNFSESHKTVIALSGGIDSKAAFLIAKEAGLNPDAVTFSVSAQQQKTVEKFCKKNNSPVHVITDRSHQKIFKKAEKTKSHPCGRCQRFITNKIYTFARKNKYKFVGFGDMLSVGSHSIIQMGEIYRLNIPAMLSLNKEALQNIVGEEPDVFGCTFLRKIHKKYPYLKRYSIQRVLRELRCQCIGIDTAQKFIEDIEGDSCS
jgi:hypothetical protein